MFDDEATIVFSSSSIKASQQFNSIEKESPIFYNYHYRSSRRLRRAINSQFIYISTDQLLFITKTHTHTQHHHFILNNVFVNMHVERRCSIYVYMHTNLK